MKVQEKEFGTVKVTRKKGFAIITLNRPEKSNALSPELIDDVLDAQKDIADELS